jgi:hypothetical protein
MKIFKIILFSLCAVTISTEMSYSILGTSYYQSSNDDDSNYADDAVVVIQSAEATDVAKPAVEKVKIPTTLVVVHEESAKPAVKEQVKVVKVYPVYNAISSAMESVKNAARDMYNYLVGLMSRKESSQPASVKIQSQSSPSAANIKAKLKSHQQNQE